MKKEDIDRYMKFLPAYRPYKDLYVFFDEKDYKRHCNGGFLFKEKERKNIRIDALKELLEDDYCYGCLEKLFFGTKVRTRICYLGGPKILDGDFYTRKELISFFDEAIARNSIELSDKAKERLNNLKNAMTYDSFINNYKDKHLEIEVEGKTLKFNFNTLIDVLNMSENDFVSLFKNNEIINGVTREEFAYVLKQFIGQESIFDKYYLPKEYEKKYNILRSYEIVDFESINSVHENSKQVYKDIKLNQELRNYLYEGMPSNLSNIEKAIYLYSRACKLFTYDEEFYLSSQKGVAALKHQDIDRLSEIGLSDKEIVCYEFTAIYAKLLEELGIKYEVDYSITNEYGSGHNKLSFKEGKYLVEVDAVSTIFRGDLVRAKVGYPLVGIKCLNANNDTNDEFVNKVNKVYNMVNIMDKPFNEAVNEYEKMMDYKETISFEEKVNIYFEKLAESGKKLNRMDALGYAFLLSGSLFTKEEKGSKIHFAVYKKENEPKDRSILIISINEKGYNISSSSTKYMIYELNGDLKPIDREELKRRINSREITVADQTKSKVPGLGD